MRVITLTNGQFAQNCYLVSDEVTREAVIIDPGEEAKLILARVASERLEVGAVWLTHAHLDHVAGVKAVVEEIPVPVWLHPDDLPLYRAFPEQAAMLGLSGAAPPEPDESFVPGEQVRVGGHTFEVRHTPGHSPGSVTLVGEACAFVGDLVFAGSVGRVDLPGGDADVLLASIRREILTLADHTVLYAGHGPETTVGKERSGNPFITGVYPLA